jgi:hypothetical protein
MNIAQLTQVVLLLIQDQRLWIAAGGVLVMLLIIHLAASPRNAKVPKQKRPLKLKLQKGPPSDKDLEDALAAAPLD